MVDSFTWVLAIFRFIEVLLVVYLRLHDFRYVHYLRTSYYQLLVTHARKLLFYFERVASLVHSERLSKLLLWEILFIIQVVPGCALLVLQFHIEEGCEWLTICFWLLDGELAFSLRSSLLGRRAVQSVNQSRWRLKSLWTIAIPKVLSREWLIAALFKRCHRTLRMSCSPSRSLQGQSFLLKVHIANLSLIILQQRLDHLVILPTSLSWHLLLQLPPWPSSRILLHALFHLCLHSLLLHMLVILCCFIKVHHVLGNLDFFILELLLR